MKTLTKFLAGAATAAALTVSAASPAQAQFWDNKHDNGIDTGDIITGVAVLGGIAAIVAALDHDGQSYGYDNRYRYRDDYTGAVNACGYEAQRYGQGGQVSITDVDRRSSNRYRVRGVINAGYALMGLQTYFTAGPKEVRAWTIHKGDTAPKAAGVIHTDFEKGFIRAEVIAYNDYIAHKGEHGAKDAGKMRLEGKDYIVKDGDVMHFRFNV